MTAHALPMGCRGIWVMRESTVVLTTLYLDDLGAQSLAYDPSSLEWTEINDPNRSQSVTCRVFFRDRPSSQADVTPLTLILGKASSKDTSKTQPRIFHIPTGGKITL